jgi:hypothetical protein
MKNNIIQSGDEARKKTSAKLGVIAAGLLTLAGAVQGANAASITEGVRYDLGTEKYRNELTVASPYAAVKLTTPLDSSAKDASANKLELQVPTRASTAENKVLRHLLPSCAGIVANADGTNFGAGLKWTTPLIGHQGHGVVFDGWALTVPEKHAATLKLSGTPKTTSALASGILPTKVEASASFVNGKYQQTAAEIIKNVPIGKSNFVGASVTLTDKPKVGKSAVSAVSVSYGRTL